MGLKHVVLGCTSIMTSAILDLWVAVYRSGPEFGIDPRIIGFGFGSVQSFLYILGMLLLCRGMQVEMRDLQNRAAFTDEMVIFQVDD